LGMDFLAAHDAGFVECALGQFRHSTRLLRFARRPRAGEVLADLLHIAAASAQWLAVRFPVARPV
jgi:hypothetical protein